MFATALCRNRFRSSTLLSHGFDCVAGQPLNFLTGSSVTGVSRASSQDAPVYPWPPAVPTAALESDHRDSNCGSPCEGTFVKVKFSPIAGASTLNMAGPQ